jgi:hypothetical protein
VLLSVVWDVVFGRKELPSYNKQPPPYDPNKEEQRLASEEQRQKYMREEEIENSAYELEQLEADCSDKEALEIYEDYETYYVTGLMSEDIKTNFENRLIAKAKAMREAEELRLAQEEAEERAREREQLERERKRMIARYGSKGVEQ